MAILLREQLPTLHLNLYLGEYFYRIRFGTALFTAYETVDFAKPSSMYFEENATNVLTDELKP